VSKQQHNKLTAIIVIIITKGEKFTKEKTPYM